MTDQDSIHKEVAAVNAVDTGEHGRLIRLHVQKVSATIPETVLVRRRRHVAPRIIELTKQDARTVIEILQHGLDLDLPGTISFMLYGREEL